jgi:hypothetical protein
LLDDDRAKQRHRDRHIDDRHDPEPGRSDHQRHRQHNGDYAVKQQIAATTADVPRALPALYAVFDEIV